MLLIVFMHSAAVNFALRASPVRAFFSRLDSPVTHLTGPLICASIVSGTPQPHRLYARQMPVVPRIFNSLDSFPECKDAKFSAYASPDALLGRSYFRRELRYAFFTRH